jgi:hypothetical protein
MRNLQTILSEASLGFGFCSPRHGEEVRRRSGLIGTEASGFCQIISWCCKSDVGSLLKGDLVPRVVVLTGVYF